MRAFFLALILLLSLAVPGLAETPNPEMVRQFSSDMRGLMKLQSPKLDVPLTDEAIESAIVTAMKRIEREDPTRFATSKSETEQLAKGENVVTDEELKKGFQDRRNYDTILPFPPLLDYYQTLHSTSGLNHYQRLIAFRLAKHSLQRARTRDEIHSKIQNNKS